MIFSPVTSLSSYSLELLSSRLLKFDKSVKVFFDYAFYLVDFLRIDLRPYAGSLSKSLRRSSMCRT